MDGDAAALALGQRGTPAGLVRGDVQHRDEIRPVRQKAAAEFIGVLAGGMG